MLDPDPTEFQEAYCSLCDCSFELRITDSNELEASYCPWCGEALEPDEL